MAAERERMESVKYFDFIRYYFEIISPTNFLTLLFLPQFSFFCLLVGYFGCFVCFFQFLFWLFFSFYFLLLVRRSGFIAVNVTLCSDTLAKCSQYSSAGALPSSHCWSCGLSRLQVQFSPESFHRHVKQALEGLVAAKKIQLQFTELKNGW